MRDNKLNKSLSGEAIGEDESADDTSVVTSNGEARNNC